MFESLIGLTKTDYGMFNQLYSIDNSYSPL